MSTQDRSVLESLTRHLPGGGEQRSGQLDMTEAVAGAIENKRHLIVRAGTGTGKSLAYLVPLVRSGRPAVIATATKALQDQLASKDVPFLAEHLEEPVVVSVLKGRSNYLCRQRLDELDRFGEQLEVSSGPDPSPGRTGDEVRALVAWAARTATGDRAELTDEPSPRAWAQVSVSPGECPGASRCPAGDRCFAEDARAAAAASQVVIVNTHLYAIDLVSEGNVLPDHELVVIDEAHQLEDIVSEAAGVTLTGGRFRGLARAVRPLVADEIDAERLVEVAFTFDVEGSRHRGERVEIGETPDLADLLTLGMTRLGTVIDSLSSRRDDDLDSARVRALSQAQNLRDELVSVLDPPPTHVSWFEGPDHAPIMRMAPVDVGSFLRSTLWDQRTAILTSATVPPALAERLGLRPDEVDQLDVGSPFAYEDQALLYCATHLPDPRSEEFAAAAADELARLIEAAGGRTLALFTSWRGLQIAAERVRERLELPLVVQGEMAKPALIERFAEDEATSLLATMGFWQGVDVPGRTLSLVVIDKLPFSRPDDPLLVARRERAGSQAFRLVDLPRTATLLAQGTGRLIRRASDRGAVAVLDRRLATASYRWDLIRALPAMARTKDPDEVARFLTELAAGD